MLAATRRSGTFTGRLLRPPHRHLSSAPARGDPVSRILLTGACGQIGQELVPALRATFGDANVIATDVRTAPESLLAAGKFQHLDVGSLDSLMEAVAEHRVDTIVHLAALLSSAGEQNPQAALQMNNMGVTNVLECARRHQLRVFSPSTVAVFGPSSPQDPHMSDNTKLRPKTICAPQRFEPLRLGRGSLCSPFRGLSSCLQMA